MKISIVMPFYNSATTLSDTLNSLASQNNEFSELILVNNASTDNSLDVIDTFIKKRVFITKISVINHHKSMGIAYSYNDGIKHAHNPIVITMHADIILKPLAIKKLVEPLENKSVVAAYHTVKHPYKLWKSYNFWQKCLFSRLVGKKFTGLDGKFDAFKRQAILSIGLYDYQTFNTAGEDSDIVARLKKIGKVVPTSATIIHVHDRDPHFSLKKLIYKHAQYAQAQGALLRKYGITNIGLLTKVFFREELLLGLLIPYFNLIALLAIISYSFIYTKEVYRYEWTNPRIILLPFINVMLLFISAYNSSIGFIKGKQTI